MRSLVLLGVVACRSAAPPPPSNTSSAPPTVHVTVDLSRFQLAPEDAVTITINTGVLLDWYAFTAARFVEPVRFAVPWLRVGDKFFLTVKVRDRDGCSELGPGVSRRVIESEMTLRPDGPRATLTCQP